MAERVDRRTAFKRMGLLAAGLPLLPDVLERRFGDLRRRVSDPGYLDPAPPRKPVRAITLGAGARGNVYGNYAVRFPDELDIVGVAEPIPIRNDRYAARHAIADEHRFVTWEHVFQRPRFADAVLVTTPDDLHYGPCMQALEMGYDVLLEKPIAPTERECRDILALAKRTGRIVAVCHVLRYAPYFIELRELVRAGAVGRLVSIQHLEPIGHVHMSHSYVRGNWHDSRATTPIILAKSCHDLDILRWIVDQPCEKISAFGDLRWFRRENAPEGSTPRCTDGCAVEAACPYSALKIYYRNRWWNHVFDLPEDPAAQPAFVLRQLETTNYGRCVYRMENDQPDHYVTNIGFAGGVTASFSMEAFTSYEGRRTRIMGSHGDIVGDMQEFVHTDFATGEQTRWEPEGATDGHGGGDWALVRDWIRAVDQQDAGLLTSTIDASIESHLMGFGAEKSRLAGTVERVSL